MTDHDRNPHRADDPAPCQHSPGIQRDQSGEVAHRAPGYGGGRGEGKPSAVVGRTHASPTPEGARFQSPVVFHQRFGLSRSSRPFDRLPRIDERRMTGS